MKVVYKKTILEKMDDEIHQSYILNKKIDKFILSVGEWEESLHVEGGCQK